MDQAHVKALAAIQPFVVEATTTKSPTPRYLADLINRATSAVGTYVFTELLQTPAIQNLKNPETPEAARAHLTLLELFSWGTHEEYRNTPNLPPLTAPQEEKLRQLSLLTLASPFAPQTTASNQLTYQSLQTSLSLPDFSSLESLITTTIYSGLLTARLSPTSDPPSVHITSVAPLRDLRPQSLPALLQILQTWETRCTNVISELEGQINTIRANSARRTAVQRRRQDVIDTAVSSTTTATDTNKSNTQADLSSRPLRTGTRGTNKRELDDQAGDDLADISSDDARMIDADDGIDVSGMGMVSGGGGGGGVGGTTGTRGGGGGGGAGAGTGTARGAKRNRGRG